MDDEYLMGFCVEGGSSISWDEICGGREFGSWRWARVSNCLGWDLCCIAKINKE